MSWGVGELGSSPIPPFSLSPFLPFPILFLSKSQHRAQEDGESQNGEPPLAQEAGDDHYEHHQVKAQDHSSDADIKLFHGTRFYWFAY